MVTATRPTTTLTLRPYQEEAIEAINDTGNDGITRPLVALPTGTGKTVVFAHLIDQRPGRSLVLAHRDELIRQAVDKLLLVNPDFDIGIVKAGENEADAPVVVASVQTLSRERRLAQLLCDFKTVVVDEGHHAVADTYRRILEHLGCFADGGPLTVGFTATPERGDKRGLRQVWDRIVYQKSILEMMLAGYLCDLQAIQVRVQIDLDQVHTRHGDFVDSELSEAMTRANAPSHVVSAYQEHAPSRKALVFTPTVQLAHDMAGAFRQAGVKAEALDGTTPDDERRAILCRLHTGETMVVANCAVLTEGFDEPSVDCVIIARPTKSKPLYIQMIGRGTRVYPGKDDLLVLDVVGASTRHSIMTANEIFDLDLGKQTVKQAVEERDRQERISSGQYAYNATGDLVAVPVNLFRTRPMHWQQTNQGAWVLTFGDGLLRLTPASGDRWAVERVVPGNKTTLWESLPLDYAMGAAEDYARREGAGVLLDPAAAWRSAPATERQLNALRKWKIPVMSGLTKGKASDLLAAVIGDR
jgi:ATP-dependent helicase IRC3